MLEIVPLAHGMYNYICNHIKYATQQRQPQISNHYFPPKGLMENMTSGSGMHRLSVTLDTSSLMAQYLGIQLM
ncbi:unnamed protein product [Ranitomeya imitator]|uniref:Uncharacterized protein n=1 Tax=Ranitomeya imitator TaxID=111125 RepID=A0ABN9LCU7_9NEOB|nr:unnamed protein product [Ranitomeya imitator]